MSKRAKRSKPAPKPKAPFKVGIYQLGYAWVELWIVPNGDGGSGRFERLPGKCRDSQLSKLPSRITIHIEGEPLWASWGTLVHEAAESIITEMRGRFHPSHSFGGTATDAFIFHFDHNQFTEICGRLGSFLCEARADFEKAWKRCQK